MIYCDGKWTRCAWESLKTLACDFFIIFIALVVSWAGQSIYAEGLIEFLNTWLLLPVDLGFGRFLWWLGYFIPAVLFAPRSIDVAAGTILSLAFLTLLHEFGHYLAARWFGIRCENAEVGKVAGFHFKWQWRECIWRYGIPSTFGGRVPEKAGELGPNDLSKIRWFAAAGPLVNLALCLVLLPAYFLHSDKNIFAVAFTVWCWSLLLVLVNACPLFSQSDGRWVCWPEKYLEMKMTLSTETRFSP